MSQTPTVAIVGRPNVGKSTLFNRLLGRRQAIVHDQPGVTRDRVVGRTELGGRELELIDTGGLTPEEDPLGLSDQVFLAIDESDAIVVVMDGREGLLSSDQRVWDTIRRYGKPVLLAVNKGDTRAAQEQLGDFYRLGVEEAYLVSAEHGTGLEALVEALARALPESRAEEVPGVAASLAIVGRPNVGKSSLVNRLLGQTRVLVSAVAGTTRDPVDSFLAWGGETYRLIDTAGIRRRSQVSGAAEGLAVLFARRQIERADLVALVVDAGAGITAGDLAIAGEAWDRGRGVVVVVNKWDLLDPPSRQRLEDAWPRLDALLAGPPRLNVSATGGRRVDRLLPAVASLLGRFRLQVKTAEVNRLIEDAVARHQPPQKGGRPWKVYYAAQVKTGPPSFLLFVNRVLPRGDSYRRYLENRLREALGLSGIPVRLVMRQR